MSMFTSLSVNEILLPRYMNWSTRNRSLPFNKIKIRFNWGHPKIMPLAVRSYCLVSWISRIHRLHLCRGVRPPSSNDCPVAQSAMVVEYIDSRETWVQSLVESYQRLKKWYLMPPCLTLSIIRYGSRVKWSNPGRGVAPFPTLRCSSYWKGSLLVTLDYGRQLYLLYNLCRGIKLSQRVYWIWD